MTVAKFVEIPQSGVKAEVVVRLLQKHVTADDLQKLQEIDTTRKRDAERVHSAATSLSFTLIKSLSVSYILLLAHVTSEHLVCRLLLVN